CTSMLRIGVAAPLTGSATGAPPSPVTEPVIAAEAAGAHASIATNAAAAAPILFLDFINASVGSGFPARHPCAAGGRRKVPIAKMRPATHGRPRRSPARVPA